ncbi:MAG: GH25 family lysozyme [Bacillota bacterium]|nr:GH25 family lysozyme [Bacillota bacterium]
MLRRYLLFFFAFLLFFSFSATALALDGSAYTDTEGHWAAAAIETWSERRVIQGSEGLFRPDDGIIRGEMALILDRIFQYSEAAENSFSDLGETWYTEAVLQVNAAGIMLGYEDLVRPEDGITRQEAVVMIARALGLDQMFPDFQLPYQDSAEVADWALPVVTALTAAGYITDSPEYFRPRDAITRAEVVVILDNIIDDLWRKNGLFNIYVEGNALLAGERILLINSHVTGDLFIAGGDTEEVILENTQVDGNIINFSGAVLSYGAQDHIFFNDQELSLLPGLLPNTYRAEDFLWESGRNIYLPGQVETGIDISEWQAEIDWPAVAADGIDFAIIRLGYRGNTEGRLNLDKRYHENMQAAAEAGMKLGIYFYSQAITPEEAVEEAQFVLENMGDYPLTYPIVFDWETAGTTDARTNGLDNTVLTDCALAFCETIAQAGYLPMIYIYGDLAYTRYELDRLNGYDWWFAGYSDTPEFYYNFRMWQYSSSGSVNGVEVQTDMNLCFLPY